MKTILYKYKRTGLNVLIHIFVVQPSGKYYNTGAIIIDEKDYKVFRESTIGLLEDDITKEETTYNVTWTKL